jgi:fumarate hydratase subunit alpha|uniref:Fumarate hydratase n=1 Tax=Desulfobacca acetoxidans TaxID=60893 RepID=A0A7V6A243_9BACT
MRQIKVNTIINAVKDAAIQANYEKDEDMLAAFARGEQEEESPAGKEIFRQLLENARIASQERIPLCQDCGLAVIFAEVGQEIHFEGGGFAEAIQEGVRRGYIEGHLRKSVCHPLTRKNTGDNTPAIIHTDIVPGDRLHLTVVSKGGGSENGSKLFMLKPAEGLAGIKDKVVATVAEAGPNVCPPMILGVGIGGNFERSAILAKKALLRKVSDSHPDPELAALEKELLASVNDLGIGPSGLGGRITALGVKILMQPCHIASLPVAINIQCHSSRHVDVVL